MDINIGTLIESIGWTLPAILSFILIFTPPVQFRYRMLGFFITLAMVAGTFWVHTFQDYLGITSDQLEPWFQAAQSIAGPVIFIQILVSWRFYLKHEELVQKIETAYNKINGNSE